MTSPITISVSEGTWPGHGRTVEYLTEGHRFALVIIRDPAHRMDCVIGCNPSTAGALKPDATMRSVLRLLQHNVTMLNLCPERATKIEALRPVGLGDADETNLAEITWRILGADRVIAAWGAVAMRSPRTRALIGRVRQRIESDGGNLLCWGRNADGTPKHPLYLTTHAELMPY